MFSSKHSSISKFSPLKEELSNSSISGSDQSIDHLTTNHGQQQSPTTASMIATISGNIQYDQNHNKSNHHRQQHSTLIINLTDSDKQIKEPLTKNDREPSGLTFKVLVGAFVAFFTNSFASGYNIGVLNTPEQILKSFFNNSLNSQRIEPTNLNQIEFIWSIAVSILVVGALMTSIITGYLANLLGRRGVIFLNVTIGLFAMFLTWSSKHMLNVPMFMAGRLIAGFHTGIASSIVPMYLMEIAPKSSASSLGTIHVMGLNGGLFVAQLLGLESILGKSPTWQLLFFVNAAFITIGLIGLYFIPESPVYLFVVKKQEDEAIHVLQQIRKHRNEVTDDVFALRREKKCEEGNNSSFFQLLKKAEFRKSLLVVCVLHAGQQLVGINAVFYYSTNTFRSVGLSPIHSQYGSIGCSLLNTISAIIASRMLKSFTSRTMILVSTIGTTFALLVLPISMSFNDDFKWLNYVTIFMMCFYVFMFSIGQGPIPFMIGGQIFDSSSMSTGMSCGCFINWFCNFLVAFAFPLLVIHINQLVFFIFFAFDILLLIFIIFRMPKADVEEINKKPSENSI